jgi:antitoxin VapB
MPQTAKLFANGRSQAVRLPREFRFEGSEVFIRRDADSGDVILSRKPGDWAGFFEMMKTIDVPEDFMADREDGAADDRDPFA